MCWNPATDWLLYHLFVSRFNLLWDYVISIFADQLDGSLYFFLSLDTLNRSIGHLANQVAEIKKSQKEFNDIPSTVSNKWVRFIYFVSLVIITKMPANIPEFIFNFSPQLSVNKVFFIDFVMPNFRKTKHTHISFAFSIMLRACQQICQFWHLFIHILILFMEYKRSKVIVWLTCGFSIELFIDTNESKYCWHFTTFNRAYNFLFRSRKSKWSSCINWKSLFLIRSYGSKAIWRQPKISSL